MDDTSLYCHSLIPKHFHAKHTLGRIISLIKREVFRLPTSTASLTIEQNLSSEMHIIDASVAYLLAFSLHVVAADGWRLVHRAAIHAAPLVEALVSHAAAAHLVLVVAVVWLQQRLAAAVRRVVAAVTASLARRAPRRLAGTRGHAGRHTAGHCLSADRVTPRGLFGYVWAGRRIGHA